jgi:pimeloyl-ACP methyl ester carboxylesterase
MKIQKKMNHVVLIISLVAVLFLIIGCSTAEKKLLFFPTHESEENGLTPWVHDSELIGYSREVESPKNIWLMLHGNGGQASSRAYAISCFSTSDSVFILEYPGYGARKGSPSKRSFNRAAKEAYLYIRETYPGLPVCVAGESIGTGPASFLADLDQPPDKLVLLVPFDKLSLVAREQFPPLLVSLLLRSDWDNVEALSDYEGPIDIYAAEDDSIIPLVHAEALAEALPMSRLMIVEGGHNDWAHGDQVNIRNP